MLFLRHHFQRRNERRIKLNFYCLWQTIRSLIFDKWSVMRFSIHLIQDSHRPYHSPCRQYHENFIQSSVIDLDPTKLYGDSYGYAGCCCWWWMVTLYRYQQLVEIYFAWIFKCSMFQFHRKSDFPYVCLSPCLCMLMVNIKLYIFLDAKTLNQSWKSFNLQPFNSVSFVWRRRFVWMKLMNVFAYHIFNAYRHRHQHHSQWKRYPT